MLNFTNLALRRGERLLIQGASFTLHPGWKVGVTGANGCGKSSLFALLRGEIAPDAGAVQRPSTLAIAFVAQETQASAQAAIEYVIDGDAELRALESAIAACDDGAGLAHLHSCLEAIDGYGARHRAARLLHGLGFAATEQQQPVHAFSGGWRVRLDLARALMTRSDLLLLDEPTNHLDLDAVLWLEAWLSRYRGTLLVISHDRDFLDGVVDHVVHIEHGTARLWSGNFSAVERQRAAELARRQAQHRRQQREVEHMRAFVDRFRAKASKARQAQSRLKALARMHAVAPVHTESLFRFHFPEPQRMPRPLLALEDAAAGYGEQAVLEGLDLSLYPGDRIGLLGRNGAGKSTLVRLLAGELAPLAGRALPAPDLAIGYFAQHQVEQLDVQASPLVHLARREPDGNEQDWRNFLGGFGFHGDAAARPVGGLSGGEKARLTLALIVRAAPQLLLLDEPTNHLDLDMRHALNVALQGFQGAVVLVSHDRHLLRTVCDALYLVADGAVRVFDGDLDDYRAWLLGAERDESCAGDDAPVHAAAGRRARRQREADLRRRLQPLRQALAEAERELERLALERDRIERALADPALYIEGERTRLVALQRRQAALVTALGSAEARWLELGEALENAEGRSVSGADA